MEPGSGTSICTTTKAAPPTCICRWVLARWMSQAQSASSRPTVTTGRSRWKCLRLIRTTWPTAETCCSGSGRKSRYPSVHDWGEDVSDLAGELVGRERLGQKVVQPDLTEALHDLDIAVTTHCHDGDVWLEPAQLPGGFGAAQRWHREVQQNEADALAEDAEPFDGLQSVLGQLHRIAGRFQDALHQCPNRFFVIGNENRTGALQLRLDRDMTTDPLRPAEIAPDRQQNGEGGALSRLAQNANGAAVAPHNAERRREAQSSTQKFGGEEGLEDAAAGFIVHAGAGIGHIDAHVVAGGDGKSFSPGALP